MEKEIIVPTKEQYLSVLGDEKHGTSHNNTKVCICTCVHCTIKKSESSVEGIEGRACY